jgi:predicted DNA-binding helix-hairpin-helix protein
MGVKFSEFMPIFETNVATRKKLTSRRVKNKYQHVTSLKFSGFNPEHPI